MGSTGTPATAGAPTPTLLWPGAPNRYGDCDEATCALEECGLTGKDSYWTTWCGGVYMCNSDGRAKCSSCPTTSAPPSPQPRDIEVMGAIGAMEAMGAY